MSKKNRKENLKEFKLPDRKQPVFKFFSKIFFKPLFGGKLESCIEELPDKAIIVSIHAAKNGPMAVAMTYPKFSAMWGHHGMLGNYKERFSYLRNVLYIQKMHKNKFVATVKALYEAVFSIFIYKGLKVIGTYTDMRLLSTVRNSIGVLDEGASVIIYPEDSSDGYFDEMRAAFPGFVILAETYYNKRGEDVPVIPAYISRKKKRLVVGEPKYVREMQKAGLSRQQIAEKMKDEINALYRNYILTDKEATVTVKDAPVRDKSYYGEEEKSEAAV